LDSPKESDDETHSTGHETIDMRLSGTFDRINLDAANERLPEGRCLSCTTSMDPSTTKSHGC
jgi:hypothetical protein